MRAAVAWLPLVPAALGCVACSPAAYEGPSPEARLDRTIAVARSGGDRGSLRELVEALDSDDPAVRLTAIVALKRLTDRSFGYEYDASPAEREEAILKWVAFVDEAPAPRRRQPGPRADG